MNDTHETLQSVPTLAPGDKFLRLPAVCSIVGMGRTWVTDRVREGQFPAAVRIGASVVWVESQVRAWMAERVAASQSCSARAAA